MKKDGMSDSNSGVVGFRDMVRFIMKTLGKEGLPGRKLSQTSEDMVDYLDRLPEVDRPEFIRALILSEGLSGSSSKVINLGEMSQLFESFGTWGASTISCLRNCAEMEALPELVAGTICRFLYNGKGKKDRVIILRIILSSGFIPYGGRVRFKGKRSNAGREQ